MLRLVTDEHVHGGIIRGLRRRVPSLDIVRVQDVGLAHTPDAQILAWAATDGRIIITRDVNTMIGSAWDRVKAGEPMPGVTEEEVRQVLVGRRGDEFQCRRKSRIRFGQTSSGRYLKVVYVPDEVRDSVFVFIPYDLRGKELKAFHRRQRRKQR